jgi:hypothetical protein
MERSFHWTEDLNQTLNYWFWLRQHGKLDETTLLDHVRHTLALPSYESHLEVSSEPGFNEFLTVWRQWKHDQITKYTAAAGMTPPKTLKEHHKAVAAVGAKPFTIQWVMASFGERWVLPPSLVMLGADGGTADERRNAVLDAAKTLLLAEMQ